MWTPSPGNLPKGSVEGLAPSCFKPEYSLLCRQSVGFSESQVVHLNSQRQVGQLCWMTRPSSKMYWLLQKQPLNHLRPVIALGMPSKGIYSNPGESSLPLLLVGRVSSPSLIDHLIRIMRYARLWRYQKNSPLEDL